MSETALHGSAFQGAMLFQPTELVTWVHTGRVLKVDFHTSVDLSTSLPEGVIAVHPHVASLTVVRAKRRPEAGSGGVELGFGQYQEAYISIATQTEAQTTDATAGEHRLAQWHNRPWPIQRRPIERQRTRHATIEQTWRFPQPDGRDLDPDWVWHDVDVHRLGVPILSFRGLLEGVDEANPEIAFGSGSLSFFASPDDEEFEAALFDALGTVEVDGFSLRDATWTTELPALQ
jgi:hypothetical protein